MLEPICLTAPPHVFSSSERLRQFMWFIILLKPGAENATLPREITELDCLALHPYLFGIDTEEIIL